MRRRLQLLLGASGAVATLAGADAVIRGTAGVRSRSAVVREADTDSELRFFAAWYVAAGIAMLRAARAPEREAATVRLISSGWGMAAVGRLLSIKALGRPHPMYTALTAAEIGLAVGLARWIREVDTNKQM